MDSFWKGILTALVVVLIVAAYIGLLIGALYLGEWLYAKFGIGGLMLMCALMVVGAVGVHDHN